MSSPGTFDIIGDIHGQAGLLKLLLQRMDYSEQNGVWHHPSRTAIFVGDFIDRGPAIPETLRIVRGMVMSGVARAVMGNHEWDALRFACDPERLGHLRDQLQQTHSQFKDCAGEWQDNLAWFRALPLVLDLGCLRVVHACWNESAVQVLRGLPPVLDDPTIAKLNDQSSALHRASNLVLTGLTLNLPGRPLRHDLKRCAFELDAGEMVDPGAGALLR